MSVEMKKEHNKAVPKREEKKLLILDIDETLIHATNKSLDRLPDFMISKYQVYKRPYLDEFLQEIKEDFLLAIWSSASDDYVRAVVEKIIPKEIKLEFVWGRSRCTLKRNLWDEFIAPKLSMPFNFRLA
jgi:RNA polymerase II subunit A small phosphatase-like protein